MIYVNWLLRVVLFLILLGFAVKNDQPVVLRYFFGYEWQSSLVLVLLIFFAAGVALGMFSALSKIFFLRREVLRLRNELTRSAPATDSTDI